MVPWLLLLLALLLLLLGIRCLLLHEGFLQSARCYLQIRLCSAPPAAAAAAAWGYPLLWLCSAPAAADW
jgi:hypothetical protein